MPLLVVMGADNLPFTRGDVISWRRDGDNDVGTGIARSLIHRVIKTDLTELECIDLEQVDTANDIPETFIQLRRRRINFDTLPVNKRTRLIGNRRPITLRFNASAPKGQQHTEPWDEEISASELRSSIETKIIIASTIP